MRNDRFLRRLIPSRHYSLPAGALQRGDADAARIRCLPARPGGPVCRRTTIDPREIALILRNTRELSLEKTPDCGSLTDEMNWLSDERRDPRRRTCRNEQDPTRHPSGVLSMRRRLPRFSASQSRPWPNASSTSMGPLANNCFRQTTRRGHRYIGPREQPGCLAHPAPPRKIDKIENRRTSAGDLQLSEF